MKLALVMAYCSARLAAPVPVFLVVTLTILSVPTVTPLALAGTHLRGRSQDIVLAQGSLRLPQGGANLTASTGDVPPATKASVPNHGLASDIAMVQEGDLPLQLVTAASQHAPAGILPSGRRGAENTANAGILNSAEPASSISQNSPGKDAPHLAVFTTGTAMPAIVFRGGNGPTAHDPSKLILAK